MNESDSSDSQEGTPGVKCPQRSSMRPHKEPKIELSTPIKSPEKEDERRFVN